MFFPGIGKEVSVLWAERVVLLFCLNREAGSAGTEYISIRYTGCNPTLDEERKEQGSVSLSWSATDEDDKSVEAGEGRNSRTVLNVNGRLERVTFNSFILYCME